MKFKITILGLTLLMAWVFGISSKALAHEASTVDSLSIYVIDRSDGIRFIDRLEKSIRVHFSSEEVLIIPVAELQKGQENQILEISYPDLYIFYQDGVVSIGDIDEVYVASGVSIEEFQYIEAMTIAQIYSRMGKVANGIAMLEGYLLRANPDYIAHHRANIAVLHLELGNSYGDLYDVDGNEKLLALQSDVYEQGIAYDPSLFPLRVNYGVNLMSLERFEEAAEYFTGMIEEFGSNHSILFENRAQAYARLGDVSSSLADLNTLLDLEPVFGLFISGTTKVFELGLVDEGIQELKTLKDTVPSAFFQYVYAETLSYFPERIAEAAAEFKVLFKMNDPDVSKEAVMQGLEARASTEEHLSQLISLLQS